MSRTDAEFDVVPPAAGSMIESLRAYGYSPGTAVADLIDNSISASARNIRVDFHWAGRESRVAILDDGCGMDEDELRNAMRPGSRSPLAQRAESDFGRFGLGLKTASFSQCRRLTVASRVAGGDIHIRRWDLDYVQEINDWRLLKSPASGSEKYFEPLNDISHGTMVLWENADRLVDKNWSPKNASAQEVFHHTLVTVRDYLSMVFHRLLRTCGKAGDIDIRINGDDEANRIQPWNPFFAHPATQEFPVEVMKHPFGDVTVQGYILPHKDRMSLAESERAAGIGGWGARQGFYVYRNRRLLVAGSWLGLGDGRPWPREEQYKLARIRIDIPNTADLEWQIDVKKSTAHPPACLRNRLYDIACKVRSDARDVFVHRGAYKPRSPTAEFIRVWKPKSGKGRQGYVIDRTHPLVLTVIDMLSDDEQHENFVALLRLLEETLPVGRIWLDTAEGAEAHAAPFETAEEVEKRRMVALMYGLLRKTRGISHEAAKSQLRAMEGFDGMQQEIRELTE